MKRHFALTLTVLMFLGTLGIVGASSGQTFPQKPLARLGKGQLTGNVSFSPDGKVLAVASSRGVWLYDAKRLSEIGLLEADPGFSSNYGVFSISFSPDGSLLASATGPNGAIQLWDVKEKREVTVLKEGSIGMVTFSPDGNLLASGEGSPEHAVRLWDVKQKREVAVLRGHTKQVFSVAFSPDGRLLASGGDDDTVRLWDVKEKREVTILRGHQGPVPAVAFSPDGNLLASGGFDGGNDSTVRLWDVREKREVAVLRGHTAGVSAVAFSPDGSLLASGGDDTVRLWDVKEKREVAVLEGHRDRVTSVAFSPDGTLLVSGSDNDDTVRFWDVREKREVVVLRGHIDQGGSVAFSPDGSLLASGGNKDVWLWSVKEKQEVAVLEGGGGAVAFSPDGRLLASAGGLNGAIQLWDVREKREVAVLGEWGVNSVAFSPDGRLLASGDDHGTVRLWDVNGRREVAVLRGHESSVYSVAFSPDGGLLASGGWLDGIRLWDVKGKKEVAVLGERGQGWVNSVAFSPDGNLLAGDDKLWDVKGKKEAAFLNAGIVESVAFSPDGSLLASGRWDAVHLWDVKGKQEVAVLRGHTVGVRSVSFSPDGSLLASGSWDGTVLLWEMKPSTPPPGGGGDGTPVAGRNPVIVIPGIMGSILNDEPFVGPPEWPVSVLKGPGNPADLQLGSDGKPPANSKSERLIPTGFIDDLVSGFYDNFVKFLERNGYEGKIFKFPYDWRRSVRDNAYLLYLEIGNIKNRTGAAKVDLVAHSMGGMVAIEAIKILDQRKKSNEEISVGKLIMVGIPHLGAPDTLEALLYGSVDFGFLGNLLKEDAKVKQAVHDMPGVYDLLPSRKYVDTLGKKYLILDLGLPNYKDTQDKLKLLNLNATLLGKSEEFHNGYDNWTQPVDIKAYVVAGHGQSTRAKVFGNSELIDSLLLPLLSRGVVNLLFPLFTDGDGTVPLDSATAMRVDQTYYADLEKIGKTHGNMLDSDKIQNLILSLLNSNESVNSPYITTTRPAPRGYLGLISLSPVRLEVYDSEGRHTGVGAEDLVETAIPGSSFYQIGGAEGSKFVTVPDNGDYKVIITALREGKFDLIQTKGTGEAIHQKVIYKNVKIGSKTIAKLDYSPDSEDLMLKLDFNGDGKFETKRSPDQIIDSPELTGVPLVIPSVSALAQNYPNPFNPDTWIPYELAEASDVKVAIYDLQGRLVRTLDLGHREAGQYFTKGKAAYWDGRNNRGEDVARGVYFYQIQAGDFQSVRKMAIFKK